MGLPVSIRVNYDVTSPRILFLVPYLCFVFLPFMLPSVCRFLTLICVRTNMHIRGFSPPDLQPLISFPSCHRTFTSFITFSCHGPVFHDYLSPTPHLPSRLFFCTFFSVLHTYALLFASDRSPILRSFEPHPSHLKCDPACAYRGGLRDPSIRARPVRADQIGSARSGVCARVCCLVLSVARAVSELSTPLRVSSPCSVVEKKGSRGWRTCFF